VCSPYAQGYRTLMQLIHIDQLDSHPDLDIPAPGHYNIQTGLLPHAQPNGAHPSTPPPHLYSPSGNCIGHLPTSSTNRLQHQYNTAQATIPSLVRSHSQGSFARDQASHFPLSQGHHPHCSSPHPPSSPHIVVGPNRQVNKDTLIPPISPPLLLPPPSWPSVRGKPRPILSPMDRSISDTLPAGY